MLLNLLKTQSIFKRIEKLIKSDILEVHFTNGILLLNKTVTKNWIVIIKLS